jgi:hypothetical protein
MFMFCSKDKGNVFRLMAMAAASVEGEPRFVALALQ